ncbi:hypothetical protein [Yoonia sp. 1_MG-2023]|uniref:hypothetical protein n=1 Tax=Yoonia sp. 1_MG-2023 TaxID=3062659 RepID=UPI0026E3A42E|nr:hypothetical protein [Yoonia sp. 1_MG-2023]
MFAKIDNQSILLAVQQFAVAIRPLRFALLRSHQQFGVMLKICGLLLRKRGVGLATVVVSKLMGGFDGIKAGCLFR